MKVRYLKTENNIYRDHLTSQRPSLFDRLRKGNSSRSDSLAPNSIFSTNFSIAVKSPYLFVVLHLKKSQTCKNRLGINIPDICLFDSKAPYDVLYSEGGDIQGLKGKQSIRIREVYAFFCSRSESARTKKQEQSIACFQNEQFLIMSDQDLFITCRKHKNDPFFKKLQYLRNKLNLTGEIFEVSYDQTVDFQYTGIATECFAGIKSQQEVLAKYGEANYLKYCNQKIALFLNYEQNIRIRKAIFCYSKSQSNQYFLTNVKKIEFHNLTMAIELRRKRLMQEEMAKSKILQMSKQKYERYKSEESKPLVKEIQTQMNSVLWRITNQLNLKTSLQEAIEEKKTEEAFKKLYPKHGQTIHNLITTSNFSLLRTKMNSEQKKKLSRPSKFMKKCFNLEKRIRATYSHFPIGNK